MRGQNHSSCWSVCVAVEDRMKDYEECGAGGNGRIISQTSGGNLGGIWCTDEKQLCMNLYHFFAGANGKNAICNAALWSHSIESEPPGNRWCDKVLIHWTICQTSLVYEKLANSVNLWLWAVLKEKKKSRQLNWLHVSTSDENEWASSTDLMLVFFQEHHNYT